MGAFCGVCVAGDWYESEESSSYDYIGPMSIIGPKSLSAKEDDSSKYIPAYTGEELRDLNETRTQFVILEFAPEDIAEDITAGIMGDPVVEDKDDAGLMGMRGN